MVEFDVASASKLADFWSWPGWTPLGVLVGAIAAVAAVVASIASIRALSQGRRSQQLANERYLMDIEPRPRLTRLTFANPREVIEVDIVNAGGAAIFSLILVQYGGELYLGGGTLPSHGASPTRLLYRLTRQGGETADPRPLIMAAKDVQGVWWDCIRGARIAELRAWWEDQFRILGIPAPSLAESSDAPVIRIGG